MKSPSTLNTPSPSDPNATSPPKLTGMKREDETCMVREPWSPLYSVPGVPARSVFSKGGVFER